MYDLGLWIEMKIGRSPTNKHAVPSSMKLFKVTFNVEKSPSNKLEWDYYLWWECLCSYYEILSCVLQCCIAACRYLYKLNASLQTVETLSSLRDAFSIITTNKSFWKTAFDKRPHILKQQWARKRAVFSLYASYLNKDLKYHLKCKESKNIHHNKLLLVWYLTPQKRRSVNMKATPFTSKHVVKQPNLLTYSAKKPPYWKFRYAKTYL